MKIRVLFLIAILVVSLPVLSDPLENSIERGEKIGRYLRATIVEQQLTYKILDYCAEKNPTKTDDIAKAKEGWNTRNLFLVNSRREVVKNWLIADKVSESDIPRLINLVDESATLMLKFIKPTHDETVKAMSAKSPEEQIKECGLFVGFVIGGGRDIRVLNPEAITIYEMYSGQTK
jgi:hypothetical protein